jgi:hypothetical protein
MTRLFRCSKGRAGQHLRWPRPLSRAKDRQSTSLHERGRGGDSLSWAIGWRAARIAPST